MGDAPCDKATGQCQCRPAYAGLHCEECALRHHNYPQCERCYCSEEGVTEKFCNSSLAELQFGSKINYSEIGLFCVTIFKFPILYECKINSDLINSVIVLSDILAKSVTSAMWGTTLSPPVLNVNVLKSEPSKAQTAKWSPAILKSVNVSVNRNIPVSNATSAR